MKKVFSAIILILVIGCGTEAPFDAEMTAPADLEVTIDSGGAGFSLTFTGPLVFQLLSASGEKPVPGVDIEFYTDGNLTDKDGNPIGAYLKTETDDTGSASVFVEDTYAFGCPTADVAYTTSVQAVAGPVSATWTATVTCTAP